MAAQDPALTPDFAAVELLALDGRLDAVRAFALRTELDDLLDRARSSRCSEVMVDLRDVVFMDSAALSTLVRLRRQCLDAGLDLTLVRPRHADALRIFRLTQFDEVFAMVSEPPR